MNVCTQNQIEEAFESLISFLNDCIRMWDGSEIGLESIEMTFNNYLETEHSESSSCCLSQEEKDFVESKVSQTEQRFFSIMYDIYSSKNLPHGQEKLLYYLIQINT